MSEPEQYLSAVAVARRVEDALRRGATLTTSQFRTLRRLRGQATVTLTCADKLFCAVGEPWHLNELLDEADEAVIERLRAENRRLHSNLERANGRIRALEAKLAAAAAVLERPPRPGREPVYLTEEDRLEARRETWRRSKRRQRQEVAA